MLLFWYESKKLNHAGVLKQNVACHGLLHYSILAMTNSYHHRVGWPDLILRLMRATGFTFSDADSSAAIVGKTLMGTWGWQTDTHTWTDPTYLAAATKRRHYLLAPDEIDR